MGTVRLMTGVSRGAAPVAGPTLDVTREQIIAFRRRTGALDERLPPGPASLGRAAWAGLQDSVPRSALHSLHARVGATAPDAWEDPSLVQVWGLRYTAYVVPAGDHAPFTLGRLPDHGRTRRVAEDLAARLHAYLQGRRLDANEAGRGLGVHPNALRYAAMTGTVLIRWDGARRPTVWTVPRPELEPLAARIELARRSEKRSSSPPTSRCSVRRLALRPRHGSFPAATRSTCSRVWIETSSSRIRGIAPPSGRRVSGRAPCWSAATSPARGVGPAPSSRSSRGAGSPGRNATPSRWRPRPCRSQRSTARSRSAGRSTDPPASSEAQGRDAGTCSGAGVFRAGGSADAHCRSAARPRPAPSLPRASDDAGTSSSGTSRKRCRRSRPPRRGEATLALLRPSRARRLPLLPLDARRP